MPLARTSNFFGKAAPLFAVAALGLAAHPAHAQTTLTATQTLNGTFFQAPMGTVNSIADAQNFIAGNTATGTFTASQSVLTNGGYAGSDNSSAPVFLGTDGASYKGASNTNLQDGIFDFNGFLNVTTPGTNTYNFATSSDDGSALFIDGTEVVNNDGLHGQKLVTADDTLSAGQHKVELVYFNHGFGGGGSANFAAGFAGFNVTNASAAPEPSAIAVWAFVGLGAAGLVLKAKKRKAAAV